MMAELVQGQASMNQPGLKADGLADVLQRARQMVGKMGGETMSHLNSASGSVEPSLYYPGQKRPGEDGVIGRGGEQITRIQLESGCKIQIAAGSKGVGVGGDPGEGRRLQVPVPRFAVGIVIGRNGEMIKKIQNDAGVRIQFKADDGISPERVAMEVTYTIPADKCGLVIGKGGETIKSINQQSGAHVELQRNPPPSTDPNTRVFTIRGTAQQMDLARQLIDDKIGDH
ncbi:Far upstream element-binding protein 3 [Larimichthys crocea]|nr:Far upstream element-binding protein 3 [Larimichthys crocea]